MIYEKTPRNAKVSISLISHYNKVRCNILVDKKVVERLMSYEYPIAEIIDDICNYSQYSKYAKLSFLTQSQAKKLKNWLSGIDYWDDMEINN